MNDFEIGPLESYLVAHLHCFQAPLTIERFAGGQSNPTYRLHGGDGTQYVLRKKPAGNLLPSAHAVEREYRVIAALQSTNVPVAPSFHLCEDSAVIGTPFYVMGFVQGRVFWDPTLPELAREERVALYENVNHVIADLHSVDPASVGLTDYGKPGDFLARQTARWSRQYRASETALQPAMNKLIEWLPSHVPRTSAATIVHGDLRLDNMIIHPTQPRVVALLDWELSTLGDPLADFSYHMLTWHLRADEFRRKDEYFTKFDELAVAHGVEKLKTKQHWRREFRAVLPQEEPVKVLKRNRRSPEGSSVIELKMFGSWQTKPYEVQYSAVYYIIAVMLLVVIVIVLVMV